MTAQLSWLNTGTSIKSDGVKLVYPISIKIIYFQYLSYIMYLHELLKAWMAWWTTLTSDRVPILISSVNISLGVYLR